jgi:hypothetical protein
MVQHMSGPSVSSKQSRVEMERWGLHIGSFAYSPVQHLVHAGVRREYFLKGFTEFPTDANKKAKIQSRSCNQRERQMRSSYP